MQSEQAIQRDIIKYLESKGYWTCKVVSANKRGVPDILACSPEGEFTAIEVKRGGLIRTVSKLQQYQIDQIQLRNGVAFAADSLDKVKEILDKVQNNV